MGALGLVLNNRNVCLLSLLIIIAGIALTCFSSTMFNKAIQDANKDWDKALKFSQENADEFPYSVKTQQGGLFAEGQIMAASPLITNENIDGEYMAIRETFEEYRRHTYHYSCNCRTIDDSTECDTCEGEYWSWDYDHSTTATVEKISLLGQEMDAGMIPWKSFFTMKELKNGGRYIHHSSRLRSSFSVLGEGITGKWGFVSDENGFRYEPSLSGPKDGWYKLLKWAVGIIIMVGSIVLAVMNILCNYEQSDQDDYI